MGEIMEISGLDQGEGYTSFLAARITRGGAPYSGPVSFLDDDGKKVKGGTADGNGIIVASFLIPKVSSITVAVPGMENVVTAHGLTVSSTNEARDNMVTLNLPAGGGPSIASTSVDTVLKWAIPLGIAGVVGWIIWKKYQNNIMDGLGWLGIIEPCDSKQIRKSRPRRSQKWCLMDSKGKKVLGRHSSKRKAIRQERAIQMRKRG
jgi:hypothetical protein